MTCCITNRSQTCRSEEHTSELQSLRHLVCRLLLEKKIRRLLHSADSFVPLREEVEFLDNYLAIELVRFCFFFFNDTATTEIYTLSLHDALPICQSRRRHPHARPGAGSLPGRLH